ncbi:MAG: hypothetical protein ACN6ON_12625 [Sphingobacterium sp.]
MKIYNYLFYKGYQMAVRSGNYQDIPVFGALLYAALCLMFNIFTLLFLLEGANIVSISFPKQYRFVLSAVLFGILLFYYLFRGRYKKIIEKYERREEIGYRKIEPILVIVFYVVLNFGLLLLAGLYRHGEWIFKR